MEAHDEVSLIRLIPVSVIFNPETVVVFRKEVGSCVLLLDGACVVGNVVPVGEALGVTDVGTSGGVDGDAVVGICDGAAVVALDVGVAEGEPVGAVVASACVGVFVGVIVTIDGVVGAAVVD